MRYDFEERFFEINAFTCKKKKPRPLAGTGLSDRLEVT